MTRVTSRTYNTIESNEITLETKIGEVTVERVGIEQIANWMQDKAITGGKYLSEVKIPLGQDDVSKALYRLTLTFGPPQLEGNFEEWSFDLILRYKGHIFYIRDHLGGALSIGYWVPYYRLKSGDYSKEPPTDIIEEFEKIIEDVTHNPVEAFEYQDRF